MGIRPIDSRKVYFSASMKLAQKYERVRTLAKENGLLVDFSQEFEKWFNSLLSKTEKSIVGYSGEKRSSEKGHEKSAQGTQAEPLPAQKETESESPC